MVYYICCILITGKRETFFHINMCSFASNDDIFCSLQKKYSDSSRPNITLPNKQPQFHHYLLIVQHELDLYISWPYS